MEYIGSYEAKTHWSDLLEKVAAGQNIIITKHGKPIARITPELGIEIDNFDYVVSQIKTIRQGARLDDLDWKSMRDEGRS